MTHIMRFPVKFHQNSFLMMSRTNLKMITSCFFPLIPSRFESIFHLILYMRITHSWNQSWGSLLSMIIKETNKCVEKNEIKSLAMGCPFIYCAHIKYQVPSNNDLCVITTIRLVFKNSWLMIDKNYEFYEKWLWDDFLIICQNICFENVH